MCQVASRDTLWFFQKTFLNIAYLLRLLRAKGPLTSQTTQISERPFEAPGPLPQKSCSMTSNGGTRTMHSHLRKVCDTYFNKFKKILYNLTALLMR